jgi:ubiquinone/menaquinone biosynthesis C-methylase UbiE
MSAPASAVTPARFFNIINSYQNVAVLKAAIELGFFTAIGQGRNTADQLAKQCRVHPRGARILADHLTVLEFLKKSGDTYTLAEDAALFLDQNSQAYIGHCIEFLLSPTLRGNFDALTDRVRAGGAPADDQSVLVPNHDVWVKFARGMAGLMLMPAETLARQILARPAFAAPKAIKVLDIAAGHGIWGIAFAQQNPQARVVGLDWPNVLEVAKEHAGKFGVGDRYATLPGDALHVPLGGPYDIVLIPNFLHHLDAQENTAFLKKVHAALKPGGIAVAVEFAPNDDRVSPPASATFAVVMLAGTPAGDAYTAKELKKMYEEAGFKNIQWADLPMSMQRTVTGEK